MELVKCFEWVKGTIPNSDITENEKNEWNKLYFDGLTVENENLSEEVPVISSSSDVKTVTKKISEQGNSNRLVAVKNNGTISGTIGKSDLCVMLMEDCPHKCGVKESNASELKNRYSMSLISVKPNDSVITAVEMMNDAKLDKILVYSKNGCLPRVLTRQALIKQLFVRGESIVNAVEEFVKNYEEKVLSKGEMCSGSQKEKILTETWLDIFIGLVKGSKR